MVKEKYLNISQFALLTGTTRQTLIYYDRIGLFSPEKICENGYRQYSYNQIKLITAIETLAELKVPLKEIKKIVSNLSPQSAEKLFEHQLGIISKEIVRLERLRDMTKLRLEQTRIGCKVLHENREFSVVDIEVPVPLYIGKALDVDKNCVADDDMTEFYNSCEAVGLPFGYTQASIVLRRDVVLGRYNIVHRFAVRLKDENLANSHIPAGKYAVGYSFGDYGQTDYIYPEMLKFIEQNGYVVVGNAYENYILDEVVMANSSEYVIKIMIAVGRRAPENSDLD